MMKFVRKTWKIALALPLLTSLMAPMALPGAAFANNQGPGGGEHDRGGQGDRPERQVVPIQTLVRMSKAGLSDLNRVSHRIEIGGVMGRYSPGKVIAALEFAPGRTKRLIERMENTVSPTERMRIVDDLLHVHARRYAEHSERQTQTFLELRSKGRLVNDFGENAFGQTSDDPQVEAYYRGRDEYVALYNYVELLKDMRFANHWNQ